MMRNIVINAGKLCFVIALVFSCLGALTSNAEEKSLDELSDFSDVPVSHWAKKDVTKMAMLGVVQGPGDGTFLPDRNVSRQEAVLMALRLMGLEDEAEASNITINHDFQVDDYFKPYIDYAFNIGLLSNVEELKVNGQTNWGSGSATREWIAKLTIRTINGEEQSDSSITFEDHDEISDWATGYVNAAVNLGIVNGIDGNFLPQEYVTRAQLAAFFGRAEPYLSERSSRVTSGFVENVDEDGLTVIDSIGEEHTFSFTSSPVVYSYTQSAPLLKSDIEEGQSVFLIHEDGTVYFVEVLDQMSLMETATGTYLRSNLINWTLEMEIAGSEYSYDIDQNFSILDKDGSGLDYASLVPGSEIEVRYLTVGSTKTIHQIMVIEAPVNKMMIATIYEIDTEDGILVVLDQDLDEIEEYPINAALLEGNAIPYGEREISIEQLVVGDEVEVVVQDSVVTKLELIEPVEPIYETLQGTVDGNNLERGTLYLVTEDEISGYRYADNVTVILDGLSDPDLDDIASGDEVTIYLNGENEIVRVEIANRSIATRYLVDVLYYDPITKSLIVRDEDNTAPVTYQLSEDTIVKSENTTISHDQLDSLLTEGEKVDIVYSTGTNTLFSLNVSNEYEGTISRIDHTNQLLTITNSYHDELTFVLSSGTDYEIAGQNYSSLDDFASGDPVVVMMNSNKSAAAKVMLKQSKTYTVLTVNASARKVYVEDDANNKDTLYISSQATIKDSTKVNPDIGDIEEGQTLFVEFEGEDVVEVGIASIAFGKVESVNEANGTFVITNYNNGRKKETFELNEQNLEIGDRVYVVMDPEGNMSINKLVSIEKTFSKLDDDNQTIYFLKKSVNDKNVFYLHEEAVVRRMDTIVGWSLLNTDTPVLVYVYNDTVIELVIQ